MKKKDYRKWIERLECARFLDGLKIGRLVKEKDEWLMWKAKAEKQLAAHTDNYSQLETQFHAQLALKLDAEYQRDQAEKENIALHHDVQAAEAAYEAQAALTINAAAVRAEILQDFIQLENTNEENLQKLFALRNEATEQDKVIAKLREDIRLLKEGNGQGRVRPICKAVVGLNCVQDPQCAPGYCQRQDKAEEAKEPAAFLPWCGHGGIRCMGGSCPGPTNCHRNMPF